MRRFTMCKFGGLEGLWAKLSRKEQKGALMKADSDIKLPSTVLKVYPSHSTVSLVSLAAMNSLEYQTTRIAWYKNVASEHRRNSHT